tara:strand:+ start:1081 stop:1824 length:744 start_codon:yes stop_codon:yes gene_type:complete
MSEKEDYLDTDPPISGQNYVCLSFVSPDELIQKKEGFQVAKFLQSYAKDKDLDFKQLYEDYENYIYKYSNELQRDFDKENKFQTSMRGIKIRGVYSTKEEAERRAQKLQRMDDTFHVFVGDVGAWLPWDPCADNVENEVFSDTALQDLMQKYKENSANKDIFYEDQKREKIKEAAKKNAEAEMEKKQSEKEGLEENVVEPIPESEPEPEPEPEPESEPEPEDVKVDESLKSTLEDTDPWLKNKIDQA